MAHFTLDLPLFLRYFTLMEQTRAVPQRIDLRLDPDATRQLDALCHADVRTRPLQIRWLIARESERRAARESELPA